MDNFKEYINLHQSQFIDDALPNELLFSKINNSLQHKPTLGFYSWGKYAIAACIVGMIFIFTFNIINNSPTKTNIVDTSFVPCKKQTDRFFVDTQKNKTYDTPSSSLHKKIEKNYVQPICNDDSITMIYMDNENEILLNNNSKTNTCTLNSIFILYEKRSEL